MNVFRNALFWKNFVKSKTFKIMFAVKVGLAGGAVYYLADTGVWRESTETTKLYQKISTAVSPYVQDAKSQLPIEIPDLPDTNKISYVTKHYWNEGVTTALTYLGNLPTHVSEWTRRGIDAAKKNAELQNFVNSMSGNQPVSKTSEAKTVDSREEK